MRVNSCAGAERPRRALARDLIRAGDAQRVTHAADIPWLRGSQRNGNAYNPAVHDVVPICGRWTRVSWVGASLKRCRRGSKRVWRGGGLQTVFADDLQMNVGNTLGGFDRQQNQEIAPCRFVGAKWRPLISIQDGAATSRGWLTTGPREGEAAAGPREKPLDRRRVGSVRRQLVVIGVGEYHRQHDDSDDAERNDPALTAAGFPRFHALRPKKDPHSERERTNDDGEQTNPCTRGGGGNASHGQRKPESVLEEYSGAHQGEVARARGAVALRHQEFLKRVHEQNAHARGGGSGDALAYEQHANERTYRDAGDEQAWSPDQ